MNAEVFLDSNVLLHFISPDPRKAAIAERLIRSGAVISTQVLNEFAAVARRKKKLPLAAIRLALDPIKTACRIIPLTLEIHELGLVILGKTNLGIYDSMIVAAAEFAGCAALLTEDLNHGQRIGNVTIRNPFV